MLVLAALLVAFRTTLRERIPLLVLLGWALLVAPQIAVFRDEVAPWYASPMALFWAGLLVLLAGAPLLLRSAGILAIALLALRVQLTWEDKSFYLSVALARLGGLSSRMADGAADLRRAPVPVEGGQPGQVARRATRTAASLGLRRPPHVSPPGRRRPGRVAVATPGHAAFLSRDDRTPGDLNDFHRLDLVLAPGAAMTWRVDLPPDLRSARFETRVRAAAGDPMLARGARVTVDGESRDARVLVPAGERAPLSLDLRPLAGRTVTLRIEAEEATGRRIAHPRRAEDRDPPRAPARLKQTTRTIMAARWRD